MAVTEAVLSLDPAETRVLGALIEKDITTPDYYPLSLNALVNACNQKSNRDPVMALDEDAVRRALYSLQQKRLAGPARGSDSRVTKYEHRLQEVFNLTRGETALLCELLLRGAQTPGELRGRAERMHRFEDLDQVQGTLQKLGQRDVPLAEVLARQPGTKEARYRQLLSIRTAEAASLQPATEAELPDSALASRVAQLEQQVERLSGEVSEMRSVVSELKRLLS
jgi:uncharacterized protein YceH (UPF0502 family)